MTTPTNSFSGIEDMLFGIDTLEQTKRQSENDGRHVKLTSTPEVFTPLTNLNHLESAAEILREVFEARGDDFPSENVTDVGWINQQIRALDESEKISFFEEVARRTAFSIQVLSVFLNDNDVEAYNKTIPQGTPAENGYGRLGKALKFQVRFSNKEIEENVDTDAVAWLIANYSNIANDMAVGLKYVREGNGKYALRVEQRWNFIVRDDDGAERIVETSSAQASSILETVSAIDRVWRGNRWSIGKTGTGVNTKMVVRFAGNGIPLDEEDDFYPQRVDYTNRAFGVSANDSDTRNRLIVAIVGEKVLDSMKPKWYVDFVSNQ